jgi:hypothetical protein
MGKGPQDRYPALRAKRQMVRSGVVAAVAGGALAMAPVGASAAQGKILACYSNKTKALSYLKPSAKKCGKHETLVSWEQAGPQGSTGSQGPQGASGVGTQGPQGVKGATGPAGALSGYTATIGSKEPVSKSGGVVDGLQPTPGDYIINGAVGIVASANAPAAYPGCQIQVYDFVTMKVTQSTPYLHGYVKGDVVGAADLAVNAAFAVKSNSVIYLFCDPENTGQSAEHVTLTATRVTKIISPSVL